VGSPDRMNMFIAISSLGIKSTWVNTVIKLL